MKTILTFLAAAFFFSSAGAQTVDPSVSIATNNRYGKKHSSDKKEAKQYRKQAKKQARQQGQWPVVAGSPTVKTNNGKHKGWYKNGTPGKRKGTRS